jgi:hypothetical protein
MGKSKLLVSISILILVVIIVGLGVECFVLNSKLQKIEKRVVIQSANTKILSFLKLIVNKVLLGSGQVSFNDRLQLENTVRDINDQKIFAQWQKFTESQSDKDTQQNLGTLFNLLLEKILY